MEFNLPWDNTGELELVYIERLAREPQVTLSRKHTAFPGIGNIILSLPREKYTATNGEAFYDLLECDGDTFSKDNYPKLYTALGSDILPFKKRPSLKLRYYIVADLHL